MARYRKDEGDTAFTKDSGLKLVDIDVDLSDDTIQVLERLAELKMVTVDEIVEEALAAYIKNKE